MMRLFVLTGALALAAAVPSTAPAQSVPNVSGIKRTTQRAVNKTNAHTLAMTGADSGRAGGPVIPPAAAGGKAVEKPATDTARGRGVRATATGAATATRAPSVADTAGKIVIKREVFAYEQSGRRDPFVSLMTVGELRPMISDLVVSGILIDPSGRGSVAVLRDVNTREQYRVRVGQQLGRMRVARIAQKAVTFTIEEFGYSRQQELALEDSNQARTK
ncbi:MAG TPA: hypothetical protein VFZ21_09895 [Gemmatimonadaceae bacterium]|jgi:hypothetical protein|nr:hypothetical protein [Gemmatimonadaceae bacterium]